MAKHPPDAVFVAPLQSDTRSYKEYFTSLRAVFGPVLKGNKPLNLVVAQPVEACGQSSYLEESVLTNKADCPGKAVIIDRGTCYFVDKVPCDALSVYFEFDILVRSFLESWVQCSLRFIMVEFLNPPMLTSERIWLADNFQPPGGCCKSGRRRVCSRRPVQRKWRPNRHERT